MGICRRCKKQFKDFIMLNKKKSTLCEYHYKLQKAAVEREKRKSKLFARWMIHYLDESYY